MIMSFRHKGLRDLFLPGKTSGVMAKHVKRYGTALLSLTPQVV